MDQSEFINQPSMVKFSLARTRKALAGCLRTMNTFQTRNSKTKTSGSTTQTPSLKSNVKTAMPFHSMIFAPLHFTGTLLDAQKIPALPAAKAVLEALMLQLKRKREAEGACLDGLLYPFRCSQPFGNSMLLAW